MDQVVINFDALKDIALRGIRRTSVFLGLGINAARDERLKKWQLTTSSMFRVIPNDVDVETINHFKSTFE